MNRKKPSFTEMESMLKSLAQRDKATMDRDMSHRLLDVIREEHRSYFRRRTYARLAQCAAVVMALLAVLALLPFQDSTHDYRDEGLVVAPPPAGPTSPARELRLELLQDASNQSFYPEANTTYDTELNMQCGFAQSGAYDIEPYPVTL